MGSGQRSRSGPELLAGQVNYNCQKCCNDIRSSYRSQNFKN